MIFCYFEYLNGYFTAWIHAAALMNWLEPTVQIIATIIGGLISFKVAKFTLNRQEDINNAKARDLEISSAKDAATLAFYKLMDCGEILANMRNQIDEQIAEAAMEGRCNELYQMMRPATGRDYSPERVALREVQFLSKADSIGLISDISLVYRRTLNCVELSDTYSRLYIDFDTWVVGLPGHKGQMNGEIAMDLIPIAHKAKYERATANLNNIGWNLIQQTEESITLTIDVIDRLGAACKKEFGSDFPVVKASYASQKNTLKQIRLACFASGTRFEL